MIWCANKGIRALPCERQRSGRSPNTTWQQVLLSLAQVAFLALSFSRGFCSVSEFSHTHVPLYMLFLCLEWHPSTSFSTGQTILHPAMLIPLVKPCKVIIPLNSWSNCELDFFILCLWTTWPTACPTPGHEHPPGMGHSDSPLCPRVQHQDPSEICCACDNHIQSACSIPPLPTAMRIIFLSRTAGHGIFRRFIAYCMGTMPTEPLTVNSRKQCCLLFSYNRESCQKMFIHAVPYSGETQGYYLQFLSSNCNSIPRSLTQDSKFQGSARVRLPPKLSWIHSNFLF